MEVSDLERGLRFTHAVCRPIKSMILLSEDFGAGLVGS